MRYLLILLLFGCSAVKQDQRAVDRVLGSRQLIDRIYPTIEELYPCIIDTIVQYQQGITDTVISVYVDTDTIVKHDTCTDKITTINKVIRRVDTVTINKVDQRQHLLDQSLIERLKGSESVIKEEFRKSQKHYRWALIIIGILVVLLIIKIFKL